MRVDERTVGEYAGRAGVFEVMVVVRAVRRYVQLHPRGTQTGSRASTVSGSRARTSNPAAATSFLEKDSAGIGLAKVEAAARITRPVSDQRLEKAAMVLLTESQEGSENTGELHCGCCGGGFFCRRQSEWTGFESRSNGERWRDWKALPSLKYRWVASQPPAERLGGMPKRKQTLDRKRKAAASVRREAGGCLVPKRKSSQNGSLKGTRSN